MAGFEILFLFFVTCFQSVKEILSLVLVIDRLSLSTSHVREFTAAQISHAIFHVFIVFESMGILLRWFRCHRSNEIVIIPGSAHVPGP